MRSRRAGGRAAGSAGGNGHSRAYALSGESALGKLQARRPMNQTRQRRSPKASRILTALVLSLPAVAYGAPQAQAFAAVEKTVAKPAALWRDPGNIEAL